MTPVLKTLTFAASMNNPEIININFMNWEKHLKEGVILLDFWADWCTACLAQDEIYTAITKELKGSLRIAKINVSDNRLLAEKFGVQNIPQLILLKNGEELIRIQGVQSKSQLMDQIKNYLS